MRIPSVILGDNDELIAAAARLWIKPTDRVVDTTYGEGVFWKIFRPPKLVKHDLYKLDGVDCRSLPHRANSFDVLVLDLPYTSIGGRETSTLDQFNDAYGLLDAPTTPAEVDKVIADGICEAHRVLRKGGRLFVKVADYISSGKYHQGRHNAVCAAHEHGFVQVDEFILVSGLGAQPSKNLDGSQRRQVHSHRAHSVLLIFEVKK